MKHLPGDEWIKAMDQTLTTPTLNVEVRYTSANERLLDALARHLSRLTDSDKPFILTVAYDGERFAIWEGRKAGII